MSGDSYHVAVEMLERRRVDAMLAGNVDALEALLHPDLLFGHTDGHAEDKAAYLARFRTGAARYFDAEQRIVNVRIVGDTALVGFRLKMRAELATGSQQLNVAGLTVWVLRAGAWTMIAHHPTVVGP